MRWVGQSCWQLYHSHPVWHTSTPCLAKQNFYQPFKTCRGHTTAMFAIFMGALGLFRTQNSMEACFLTFLAHDSEILEERIDKGRSSDNFANLTRLSDAAHWALKHGFIISLFLPSAWALLYAYELKCPHHTDSLIPWVGIP